MCARQGGGVGTPPRAAFPEPLPPVAAAPADAPSASTNAETAASTANLTPFIWPPSGRVSQAARSADISTASVHRKVALRSHHDRTGPKKFAEPVAVSSTSEQCIRLPPSSSPGGFGLVPLRARRDAHAAVIHGSRQLRSSPYLRTSSRDALSEC